MTGEQMKLIILDRDGVINYDSEDYIRKPEEWTPLPGSLEAIAKLTAAGYQVAIATNQSAIARGYCTLEVLGEIHGKMIEEVEAMGGEIAKISFCPHGPDDGCECRKPKPGLLIEIGQYFSVDLSEVFAIGDSLRELQHHLHRLL